MSLSDIAIKRPVTVAMVIGAIVVFGVVSYPRIGLDMMPNVEFPFVTVMTIYPGADPETVENEISVKIEEAVSTISGLRTLRSINAENVSQVLIEFELEVKADQAVQEVRDKVSRILQVLPEGVESPKVEKIDFGAAPVLTVAVGGPGAIDEVTSFARKRVKEQIQTVSGVGAVDIIGGREREVRVWIDASKLDAAGLAVGDVKAVLAANNMKFPGGRLTAGQTEFAVKVDGELKDLDDLRDLKISDVGGRGVRVRDVARVEDGLEDRRSSARLDDTPAVTLLVRKQSGTNTVEVGDRVKARLAELEKGFPAGWRAFVAIDQTVFTRTSIEHVQFDMIFGGVLAVIIVFVFLRNVRSTLIAALAIPTSVIGTFTFINAMGFTFNTLTLLALSLSIGILIDDAIVVLENIYRHVEEGMPVREAARFGTSEIGLAVLATTMSIVAVFVPVAFMRGIIGRFFYQFGLTVAVAVLISLFVAFTLTPMLCSRFLTHGGDNVFYRAIERALRALDGAYRRVVAWALRHRAATVGLALLGLGSSVPLVMALGVEFEPGFDMGEVNILVRMPTGTALAETERVTGEIAERVRKRRDVVVSTVSSIGSDAQQKQNLGSVYVKMVDKNARTLSQKAFMGEMRKEFAAFKEAVVAVENVNWMGGESGMRTAQIQFNVRGGDLADLDRLSRKLAARLRDVPGFVDLDTTYEGGKPEVQVRVDRERAAGLGIATYQIGDTVRSLVGGVEATKFREAGEDYVIRVQLEDSGRREAEQIGALKVRSPVTGQLVDLGSVARIEPGTGPTQIDRQARLRQITVLANLEEGLPLGQAMDLVNKVAAELVPSEVQTDFEGEAAFMRESFENMLFSLVLAIIIVYMVLASQFESFLQPVALMMSLVLAPVGALGGLLVARQTLSIISMIGIIMLMGLVTKNAILLIDYANTLRRRDGMERTAALLKAGPTRLRPILMTTAAMVFGMLPVALSRGHAAEMRSPMAVCVIGGLIASTLLTLVVVPVVYSLLDDVEGFILGREEAQHRRV